MLSRRTALIGIASLAGTFGLSAVARAGAFADGAGEFIQELAGKAITVLNDKAIPLDRRIARFRELFLEGFDVPSIAQFVMGRAWQRASDAQRAAYLKKFEEVTLLTWALRFNEYAGETLKLNGARSQGRVAFVQSTVIRPGRDPVRVEWRVERPGLDYKIVDIAVEGSSMAVAQRADYSAVLQQNEGKVEGLIAALDNKLAQLNEKAKQLAQN